jgi:hypothetical protein
LDVEHTVRGNFSPAGREEHASKRVFGARARPRVSKRRPARKACNQRSTESITCFQRGQNRSPPTFPIGPQWNARRRSGLRRSVREGPSASTTPVAPRSTTAAVSTSFEGTVDRHPRACGADQSRWPVHAQAAVVRNRSRGRRLDREPLMMVVLQGHCSH